jgi:hypothetical protein
MIDINAIQRDLRLDWRPITATDPKPGYIWKYFVVNAEGVMGTAERYSETAWHEKPTWDFVPIAYAKIPRLKIAPATSKEK